MKVEIDEENLGFYIETESKNAGKIEIEMEGLTDTSVATQIIYDMYKGSYRS